MSKNAFCVAITHEEGFFIGSNKDEIKPLIAGQKLKQTLWQSNPYGLEDFLKKNPDQKEVIYKAIHYWALCALKRVTLDENAYGMLKRKLSEYGNKLYRRVRNIAHSVAALFKKAFPSPRKQYKTQEKALKYFKKRGASHVNIVPV